MTFKKLIGQLHLWLGLASGLVVFILGITGCLYAFVDELKPWVYHQKMYVEVPEGTQRLPLDILWQNAQETLGQNYPLQNAEVSMSPDRTVSFRARKFNDGALWYGEQMHYYYRVFMNPYTGQTIEVENTKWEFFNLVVWAHMTLLLGHDIGGIIVACSVAIFVFLLISGIVLWWPKNKNAAKQRFWFQWKDNTKWKRKNYDLHNVLGFYSMLVLLIIALTGLVWSFEWVANTTQWMANGGKTLEKPKPIFSDTTQQNTFSLDKIIAQAMLQNPQATAFYVGLPKDAKSVVSVSAYVYGDPSFKSIRNQYDQHSAKLLKAQAFADMNGGEKLRALNYDLHVGSILRLPGKILAFFASLICASLPITGFYIWLGRRKKKKTPSFQTVQKTRINRPTPLPKNH